MRPTKTQRFISGVAALVAACAIPVHALPIITSVVETGGDNEATDTITAKMTGQTFTNGIAGPPIEFPATRPYTVPTFGEDVYAFVDRAHQWNGSRADLPIPAYLVGGEYIMIGNDNRDNANFRLDVTVSEQVIVYLLIDNRLGDTANANPPFANADISTWTTNVWVYTNGFAPVMNGLNRTADLTRPDEVSIDGDGDGVGPGVSVADFHSVYSKVYQAGTFSLYSPQNTAQNTYGVVVKRLPGSPTSPPEIVGLAPTNNTFSASAAAGLNFHVTTVAPNTLAAADIRLFLNGTQATTGLTIGGSTGDRSVSYANLAANTLYRARIIAIDQAGRGTTNDFSFDTFGAGTVLVEAEDYNFGGGQVVTPLILNGYTNMQGTVGIDYFDQNQIARTGTYRTNDYVGLAGAGDASRAAFVSAGAIDFGVNSVQAGDWLNYTRTIPAGNYNVYLRASAVGAARVQLDKVSGATTASQTATPLGVFTLASGPSGYAQLTDVGGRPVVIALGGDTTLRLTALDSSAGTLNFLALVPTTATASAAYVAAIAPVGPGVSSGANVTANVQNGSTTATAVALFVNGVNVTPQATVTPNASGFSGVYNPAVDFTANSTNNVILVLTDNGGVNTTNTFSFTTLAAATLPANIKTALGTGTGDGFNIKIHKILNSVTTLTHNLARAEDQLANRIIDPTTSEPYINEAAGDNNGIVTRAVLNFQQGVFSNVDFTDSVVPSGYIAGDDFFPNILPSLVIGAPAADPNNIALEATAYLELNPGVYRFGVRSDDGFRVSFGPTFASSPIVAGIVDVTRGDGLPAGATEFDVIVTAAGLYPMRLVYFEGTGGAALEFYTVDMTTLKRTLVNDRTNPQAVKAYLGRTADLFVPNIVWTGPTNTTVFPTFPTNITLSVDAAVTNGTIVKVEFFSGTNLLGTDTTAPFSFNWAPAEPGKVSVFARATDSSGFIATTATFTYTVGTPLVSVNFQLATTVTPAGYLPDSGLVYGDRGNGYSYGWDLDNTANARERSSVNSPDKRYDTFNHMQKPQPAGSVWEIQLPNGRYKVVGASGDATATDSVFDVQAEGVTFIRGVPATGAWFSDGAGVVTVSDGRLTISNGPTAANSKINFLDIFAMPSNEGPRISAARVGDSIKIDWTGGGMLQFKTDLNTPSATGWTDINTSGSYTESAASGNKFFRVVQP